MYAAILSEDSVLLEDVRTEAKKKGYLVVGSKLEVLEEIPHDVVLWMLFGFKQLGYSTFPIKGYVRIASTEHPVGTTHFHIAQSPWHARIYYRLLLGGMFWCLYWWERLKLRSS
jgi:hypothetical protein